MGVVRRQSIKRTFVSYVGVIIGALSVIVIYPMAFDVYGMAQFILASATLIMPFASLGFSRLTVRYFPIFRDEANGHQGFLGFLLLLVTGGFLVFFVLLLLLDTYFFNLLELLGMQKEVFWENRSVILIISFLLILNSVLAQYTSNFKRVVIPEIFNNLLIKIALPVLVLLSYYGYITEKSFRYYFALAYFGAFIGLVAYLTYLREFKLKVRFDFIHKDLFKEMMIYSAFSAFSILGYLLSFRIDNIMITSYLDYESTGYYSFFSYMVNVMVIPYMSMIAIASPIISQSIKDGDLQSVSKLYKQSSETLLIVGLYIMGGVWISMDPLLDISGKATALAPLKYVFLILATGQLINVTTGLTEPIIGYSKHYRFNFYTMALLAASNICMNIYFIPRWGIVGAALATALSIASYNLIQCIFIYIKLSFFPFSIVHLKVVFLSIVAYLLTVIVPMGFSAFLEIIIRGLLFTVLFGLPILSLGISEDISKLFRDFMHRMGSGLIK
jgi:O-antigen/teichoic acid export membrane protein